MRTVRHPRMPPSADSPTTSQEEIMKDGAFVLHKMTWPEVRHLSPALRIFQQHRKRRKRLWKIEPLSCKR